MLKFQYAVFAKFPELRKFALATVANTDTRDALMEHFQALRLTLQNHELILCLRICLK